DSLLGYSNVSFPKDSIFRLAASYYDSYDFNPNQAPPFSYDRTHITGLPTKASAKVRGMATGSRVRLLSITGNVTANWLKSAVFYDGYDRVIQTQSNNHLDLNAVDKSSVLYNTIRRVARTKLTHTAQSATTHITQWNLYDHAGRVQKTYHKINSNDSVLVAQYDYNALGQLVDKKLHKTGATSFLQSVDYRYNIRGWLTSINNDKLKSDNGITNDDTDDYFGLEMLYEKTDTLGGSQFFNGNVSAIKWKGPGKAGYGNRRSYKFAYDKSDKLKAATFQAHAGSAAANWSKEANTLNEVLTYDHNGNILTLDRKRNARTLGGSDVASSVDNLTYGYATNSNLLVSVQDTDTAGGFKNLANTGSEYAHNSDGSMTRDDNKGISSITYNMLGKPQVVTFANGQKVEYIYDASGTKLTVKTWQGATLKSVTNTAGGLVYEGSTPALSNFFSPEGRVVKSGANFEYQYAIADHQGNTRVVFTSAPAAPQSYFANMEAATNTNFNNYTSRVNFDLMDHTDSVYDQTDYSQKLYGNSGSQVGVAKSFKVYPGDKVSIRAFAKYYDPETTTSNLSGFASALVSAYGVSPPGSGEAANAWSALNNYGAVAAGGGGHANSSGSYPKAYVNLIAFDKKYNFLDGAWDQINGGRQLGSTPTAHDEMYQEYVAREEGYVYVFVSNENPTLVEVYFDDVTVTITPGNVIQANEYYPYGLQTTNSWTRSSTLDNNFLYNGGTELNRTTQVYDLYYRNYDPALGRFGQVDPKASKYGPVSPYHFAGNSPVVMNDPMGDEYDAFAVMDGSYVASGRGEATYRDMDPYGRYMTARIMAESIERMSMMRADQEPELSIADGIHTFVFGNGVVTYSYTSDESFESMIKDRKIDEVKAMFASTAPIVSNYEGGPRLWQAADGGFVQVRDGKAYIPGTEQRYYGAVVPLSQDGLQDGYINIDRFVPKDFRGGLPPDYVGVYIAASYVSMSNRFSGYNWIYNESTNHSSTIETDPNNLRNQGPFYYGEDHGYGMDHFEKLNVYSATEFPIMNFMVDLTLYGREGANYTEIGTVRYGFNFSNGILTPISPTITYKGQ
ncbi:MAG TPA: RHS repeat-associated core domain-containing protein, partial [Cyclobacteriaceae bacterium]|nr:RHS repeat-associated core domain-containing protein [Cyclobacteriaceae bacterium]